MEALPDPDQGPFEIQEIFKGFLALPPLKSIVVFLELLLVPYDIDPSRSERIQNLFASSGHGYGCSCEDQRVIEPFDLPSDPRDDKMTILICGNGLHQILGVVAPEKGPVPVIDLER